MPRIRMRLAVVTSFLAITLLVPVSARAEGTEELKSYLVSIGRLYESLEYERALAQIGLARRLAHGMEEDVTLSLYEGVILADSGRWDEATAAFKAALFLQPETRLPVVVAPKVTERFEQARQQVKEELGPILAKREAERLEAEARKQRLEQERLEAETRARQETRARVPVNPEATPRPGGGPGPAHPRSHALIPAVAGGLLLAAGGVSYGLARSELSRLRNNEPGFATRADLQSSVSRGKTFQTVGFSLAGAGVVGLGVAAGLFFLGSPSGPVSLGMSTDGTSAFLFGNWP